MKILLLDNYDSFTYNLAHYLEKLECDVRVVRNDNPSLPDLDMGSFDGLVLSPGPGLPEESGQLMAIITRHFGQIPILGVCLGMQALALHSGGTLYNRDGVMHGRTAELEVSETGQILRNVKNLEVGLYHSWAVRQEGLPEEWKITAVALDDQAPMIMEHSSGIAFGVQFHPESILTREGLRMLENWLDVVKSRK